MALMSMAEFAATHGVKKQAVSGWKTRGLLVIVDGKIDPGPSDEKMKVAGAGRFKASTGGVNRPSSVNRADPVDDRAIDAEIGDVVADVATVMAEAGVDAQSVDDFVANLKRGSYATLVQAQVIKENALALKHLVAAQLAAESVVELAIAADVIFDTFRASRDAWMSWPSRIGPLLAADLDIDATKVVEALTGYVHQQLTELGEPDADFKARRSS